MDCQAAEITDDESSVNPSETIYKEPNKGIRPVTPNVEQLRQEIFKDKEQEIIL
jgi:hypothetical protein